jgi:hypothetical protein
MHHFVTCAYLEGMLASGESRLWVYERNSDHVFRNIPKNLASKKSYYTAVGKDGVETDKVEKMLGKVVEGPGIAILRYIAKEMKQLDWEQRFRVAMLIAAQEMRVPYMRDQLSNAMKGITTAYMNTKVSAPGVLEAYLERIKATDNKYSTVSVEDIRNAVISGKIYPNMHPEASIQAMGHTLPLLMKTYAEMKWEVFIARDGEFVTSDCPVCRDYPETSAGFAGLDNKDLNIYFPISRDRVLRLSHDQKKLEKYERFMNKGREREATLLLSRIPAISYRFIPSAETERINELIIRRASRWIYSPSQNPSIITRFRGDCINLRMDYEINANEGWLRWQNRIK